MGAAAAFGGILSGGAAVLGAVEARKGRKNAQNEANAQRAHQESQATLYKAEQAKAADTEARAQGALNKQIARGNRRRIKGGLFGDAEPTQGITRTTLG